MDDHPDLYRELPSDPGAYAFLLMTMEATDFSLSPDALQLLSLLPQDGSTLSNPELRRQLGWEEETNSNRYYSARDELEDAGKIVRGRGRGGTVRRVTETARQLAADPLEGTPVQEEERSRELDLYAPMREVIAGEWAKVQRRDPICVEITGPQGGRRTGGVWSRPDIVSVEVRTFEYVPGKYVEIVTFEIKPKDAISIQAVYEALAHRRSATQSYVLLHVPAALRDELEPQVLDVGEVARSHGIGVITVDEPSDYQTWEEREIAERVEPDPGRLDAFIKTQLPSDAKRDIARRLR